MNSRRDAKFTPLADVIGKTTRNLSQTLAPVAAALLHLIFNENMNETLMFHRTQPELLNSIVNVGLKLLVGDYMLSRGIFLANSVTNAQMYTVILINVRNQLKATCLS